MNNNIDIYKLRISTCSWEPLLSLLEARHPETDCTYICLGFLSHYSMLRLSPTLLISVLSICQQQLKLSIVEHLALYSLSLLIPCCVYAKTTQWTFSTIPWSFYQILCSFLQFACYFYPKTTLQTFPTIPSFYLSIHWSWQLIPQFYYSNLNYPTAM